MTLNQPHNKDILKMNIGLQKKQQQQQQQQKNTVYVHVQTEL